MIIQDNNLKHSSEAFDALPDIEKEKEARK